mmetsp:Transcript_34182/g.82288  ORF Transcript_34182/g.82288 Transcript_34182/m.82288 type:complete len:512 (-) Transcript_34182:19-1554(-)
MVGKTGTRVGSSLRRSTGNLVKTLDMVTTNDNDNNDDCCMMEDEENTSGSNSSTSSATDTTTMNLNSHYYASHDLAPTLIHNTHSYPQHHHHHQQIQSNHHFHSHHSSGHQGGQGQCQGRDISRVSPPTSSMAKTKQQQQQQQCQEQQREKASPLPPLTQFLPSLLRQAKNGGAGLGKIPQKTLYDNLRPVVHALEQLDAISLLDLATISSKAPGCGPKVQDGLYCRPIVDEIKPPLNSLEYLRNGHSCVRYLHVAEVPDQYSIGIFVFGPYARIPLHDHPDMCVLSRVLYGDLQRQSLDLARESDVVKNDHQASSSTNDDGDSEMAESSSSLGSWSMFSRGPGSWFHSSRQSQNSSSIRSATDDNSNNNQHHHDSHHGGVPQGSKYAYRNGVDHLEAPGVTVLYPYEGNLHEFVAGEHGAAVLDILLPPYDNEQNRDCTFYNITDLLDNASSKLINHPGKGQCLIVPTHQPESFHCVSGTYRDLGEIDDDDDDDDDDGNDDHTQGIDLED